MLQRFLPLFLATILALAPLGCTHPQTAPRSNTDRGAAVQTAPGRLSKQISFSILEDYDKGQDLNEVARDFDLMNELGIDTWRGSFGWDDYEPSRGNYDFAWLHQFANLAARHGIKLRPYLGYTPAWAAQGGKDDAVWNDPPKNLDDWYNFVYHLASEMSRHRNILSYEIYNEENVPQWWDGTVAEYNQALLRGAAAIRQANPAVQVLLGGLVYPDVEFIKALCVTFQNAGGFDVVPLHAYAETWTPQSVVVENYLGPQYHDFADAVKRDCRRQPIWINEAGFATAPGKTERDQANWWARAIATFLADPEIELIGVYQLKDVKPERSVIGEGENYYLGLITSDGRKKLAFSTVTLLTDLLDVNPLTVADSDFTVTVTEGTAGALYHHLFLRPDGGQVLIIWDKRGSPTVDLRIARLGSGAVEYRLDGTASGYSLFDGRTLRNVQLTPGEVRIFRIQP